MSKAIELFQQYSAGGAEYVHKIVRSKACETLHLDFKERDIRGIKEDLSYYGKALSGFANSEGGVLVWGVTCKSSSTDEPDVAQAAVPIQGLQDFIQKLERKTDEYLQPGINGVRHKPLPLEGLSDNGFVVSFIPRAEGPPQMSVAKGHRGYYCRVGSTTKPMEHYQIADRFRERPQPKLEVFLTGGSAEGENTANANRMVHLCVRNVGWGIAKNVAVSVMSSSSFAEHSNIVRKTNILPLGGDLRWKTLAMPLEEPLYPGSYTKLAYTNWFYPTAPTASNLIKHLEMKYHAYCDGAFSDGNVTTKDIEVI